LLVVRQSYITNGRKFHYRENGISLDLNFKGVEMDTVQCMIEAFAPVDTDEEPIYGGGSIGFDYTTTREYGKNLMFEPIPLEMLRENIRTPYVELSVSGLQAICGTQRCGFMFVDPTSEITNIAYDVDTRVMVITGTALAT